MLVIVTWSPWHDVFGTIVICKFVALWRKVHVTDWSRNRPNFIFICSTLSVPFWWRILRVSKCSNYYLHYVSTHSFRVDSLHNKVCTDKSGTIEVQRSLLFFCKKDGRDIQPTINISEHCPHYSIISSEIHQPGFLPTRAFKRKSSPFRPY